MQRDALLDPRDACLVKVLAHLLHKSLLERVEEAEDYRHAAVGIFDFSSHFLELLLLQVLKLDQAHFDQRVELLAVGFQNVGLRIVERLDLRGHLLGLVLGLPDLSLLFLGQVLHLTDFVLQLLLDHLQLLLLPL